MSSGGHCSHTTPWGLRCWTFCRVVRVSEHRPEWQCGSQLIPGPEFSPKGNVQTLLVVLVRKPRKGQVLGPGVVPGALWRLTSPLASSLGGHQNTASQHPHLRLPGGCWLARAPMCQMGIPPCSPCEKLGKHCSRKPRESPGPCSSEAAVNR